MVMTGVVGHAARRTHINSELARLNIVGIYIDISHIWQVSLASELQYSGYCNGL
jgi:hypothetical protein